MVDAAYFRRCRSASIGLIEEDFPLCHIRETVYLYGMAQKFLEFLKHRCFILQYFSVIDPQEKGKPMFLHEPQCLICQRIRRRGRNRLIGLDFCSEVLPPRRFLTPIYFAFVFRSSQSFSSDILAQDFLHLANDKNQFRVRDDPSLFLPGMNLDFLKPGLCTGIPRITG